MRNLWRACGSLALLAALASLAGCSSSHPNLDALSSDPMATATFEHTELVDEYESAEGEGLIKANDANIMRRFSFSGIEAQDLVESVVAQAKDAGWENDDLAAQGEQIVDAHWTGYKSIGPVGARLRVFVSPGNGLLYISMTGWR